MPALIILPAMSKRQAIRTMVEQLAAEVPLQAIYPQMPERGMRRRPGQLRDEQQQLEAAAHCATTNRLVKDQCLRQTARLSGAVYGLFPIGTVVPLATPAPDPAEPGTRWLARGHAEGVGTEANEMAAWFATLSTETGGAWLDAAEQGDVVNPADLVNTLPPDRQPGQPHPWVKMRYQWITGEVRWSPELDQDWPQEPVMLAELRAFLVAMAEMREWFDGLTDGERNAWLDAVWSPDNVATELVLTLPTGRHSDRLTLDPPTRCWVFASSGGGIAGGGTAPHYRMAPGLQAFLELEHLRVRGEPPG